MEETKIMYTEVLGVLLALGNKYVEKLPPKVMQFLMENCDFTNIPKFDQNVRLDEQQISEEARSFLIMLKLKYWCNSEEEKQEIYKILKDNDRKYEEELSKKYNTDELFKNKEIKEENESESVDLVNTQKTSWYNKVISFLKKLFKKKN